MITRRRSTKNLTTITIADVSGVSYTYDKHYAKVVYTREFTSNVNKWQSSSFPFDYTIKDTDASLCSFGQITNASGWGNSVLVAVDTYPAGTTIKGNTPFFIKSTGSSITLTTGKTEFHQKSNEASLNFSNSGYTNSFWCTYERVTPGTNNIWMTVNMSGSMIVMDATTAVRAYRFYMTRTQN